MIMIKLQLNAGLFLITKIINALKEKECMKKGKLLV